MTDKNLKLPVLRDQANNQPIIAYRAVTLTINYLTATKERHLVSAKIIVLVDVYRVEELREKIYFITKRNKKHILFYRERVLNNGDLISHYGIGDGSEIFMVRQEDPEGLRLF